MEFRSPAPQKGLGKGGGAPEASLAVMLRNEKPVVWLTGHPCLEMN